MKGIRRQFDVSVWSRLESRWVPYGTEPCGEAKVAELEAKGWTIRAQPIERFEDGRAAQLEELANMERDLENVRSLTASQRLALRKEIRANRAAILGIRVAS